MMQSLKGNVVQMTTGELAPLCTVDRASLCDHDITFMCDVLLSVERSLYVYAINKKIVAYAVTCENNQGTYISNLLVGEPYRQQGVATAILKYLQSVAPYPHVLIALRDNTKAVSCYKKNGFNVNSVIPNYGGTYDTTALLMRKSKPSV